MEFKSGREREKKMLYSNWGKGELFAITRNIKKVYLKIVKFKCHNSLEIFVIKDKINF